MQLLKASTLFALLTLLSALEGSIAAPTPLVRVAGRPNPSALHREMETRPVHSANRPVPERVSAPASPASHPSPGSTTAGTPAHLYQPPTAGNKGMKQMMIGTAIAAGGIGFGLGYGVGSMDNNHD